jgi:aspartate/methionine/tyrosine aminotransferase
MSLGSTRRRLPSAPSSPRLCNSSGSGRSSRRSIPFYLLEKAGVGVAPGVDFGQTGKRPIRFSYASSEDNIREAAQRGSG